jgi:hypothetical protein
MHPSPSRYEREEKRGGMHIRRRASILQGRRESHRQGQAQGYKFSLFMNIQVHSRSLHALCTLCVKLHKERNRARGSILRQRH